MRKVNVRDFRLATRSTGREINRQILLNLVHEHQPISRADLARRMKVSRGVVTTLVNELIKEGGIYEGDTGEAARGRKPTFLYVRTRDRHVVAVDVRFRQTCVMLSDFGGRPVAMETFPTVVSPDALLDELTMRIRRLLAGADAEESCEGIGMVVPGLLDHATGRVLNASQFGWRNVDLRDELAARTGLPVYIENAPAACALARMWLGNGDPVPDSFVYVLVSDGVGTGIVLDGRIVRGSGSTAGEFGHIPLELNGPRCLCGSRGCWEAYTSNLATLSRYFGEDMFEFSTKSSADRANPEFTMSDLIARARAGDTKARIALDETARYLGLGLASVVNALNPERIFVGGEITAAWELLEPTLRTAFAERTLTRAAAETPITADQGVDHPRLRGAMALVTAPTFAVPQIA